MKEVKEWDGNPREMRVWDDDEEERAIVVFIKPDFDSHYYPVVAWHKDYDGVLSYKHCAEIEEDERPMTHKELARWLREKPNREYKYGDYENVNVHSVFVYGLLMEDEPVDKKIYVREGDGEWKKPLKSLLDENWHYGKEFGED